MRVILDAHLHSKYSRATSQDMNLQSLSLYGGIKGLNVIGTGDFTHPRWLAELRQQLTEVASSGLYRLKEKSPNPRVHFMLTAEVSTNFEFRGETKKIHHVIWAPSFEVVEQVNDALAPHGSLESDGRPALNLSAPALVEKLVEISGDVFIFPAHAWTPWFSIFGANSGFDRFEDCYQDQSHRIYALETGLSSDPPMNWRISALDRLAIISNSDSHSSWPWRIGREATVVEVGELTYWSIVDAIKSRDPRRFLYTIETDPAYGKYHWTGHRACGVSMPPREAIKLNNVCPHCGRRMTKGVEQRVEELADRPRGYKPRQTPAYVYLLPLSEIIATVIGAESPSSKKVWSIYNPLVQRFGNEYAVLLEVPLKAIAEVAGGVVAEAVIAVRERRLKVVPGYDGVYGRLQHGAGSAEGGGEKRKRGASSLEDYL